MLGELGDEAELAGEWRVVGGEEVAQQPLHPPSRQHQLGRPGERRGQLHHLHLHLHSALLQQPHQLLRLLHQLAALDEHQDLQAPQQVPHALLFFLRHLRHHLPDVRRRGAG